MQKLAFGFAGDPAQQGAGYLLKSLCSVLGISESGYYRYLKRKDMPSRDELLSGEIKKVLDESPYNSSYGVRQMRLAMAAENLLRQNFRADRPFQKLLTDITQARCAGGKLYISPIMDCFYGEILSLCMADNMRKELCVDTLKAASTPAAHFGRHWRSAALSRAAAAPAIAMTMPGKMRLGKSDSNDTPFTIRNCHASTV